MKLGFALVACNENTHYLDFWPSVKEAWERVVGIPCLMIYVGETLPESLQGENNVCHFKPIPGWPTATQAQVIRLLYPAVYKDIFHDAIILSDMDIIPLQKKWFVENLERFNTNQFVSLRGIAEQEKQVYMCYVAATPATFSDLFDVSTLEDVREKMIEWSNESPADGRHGGQGWCTDQIKLYQHITHWKWNQPERIGLVPWTSHFARLDRSKPTEWFEMTNELRIKLKESAYIDFHMPPVYMCRQQIKWILDTY
jgi:hypothetical protein